MRTSPKLLTTAVLAASLIACGGQDQETQSQQVNINKSPSAGAEAGTQTLSFDLNVRSALAAGISASNAKVTITKGDLQRTQNVNLDGDSASVSFNSLPIGEYQVAIQVMDGTTVVAQGSGTANVNADIQSEIDLVLNAVTGNLQVNLCMPDSSAESHRGNVTAQYVVVPDDGSTLSLRDGVISQPLAASLNTSLTTNTPLTAEFSFSQATLTKPSFQIGGIVSLDKTIPVASIDHGAQLKLTQGGNEVLSVSGCDTKVYALAIENGIDVVFAIDGEFSATLDSGLGEIETDTLTVSIEFTKEGYSLPAETTDIRSIDFSVFDKAEVFVGMPMPSTSNGVIGIVGFSMLKTLLPHIGDTDKADVNWGNPGQ